MMTVNIKDGGGGRYNNINVDLNRLKIAANNIKTNVDTIADQITYLETEKDKINGYWQGPNAKSYFLAMEANIEKLKEMCDKLRKYATYLEQVKELYEFLDSIYTNIANKIKNGIPLEYEVN